MRQGEQRQAVGKGGCGLGDGGSGVGLGVPGAPV